MLKCGESLLKADVHKILKKGSERYEQSTDSIWYTSQLTEMFLGYYCDISGKQKKYTPSELSICVLSFSSFWGTSLCSWMLYMLDTVWVLSLGINYSLF